MSFIFNRGQIKVYKFIEDGRAISIRTPAPPANWNNYLFNDDYYLDLNQVGQGSGQVIRPMRRLATGEYRYFFIKDEQSGTAWNATYRPLYIKPDHFECVHHLGYSAFHARYADISSRVEVFIPTTGCREIWSMHLANESGHSRTLSVYTVVPFSDGGLMNAQGWYDANHDIIFSYYFPYHTRYDEKPKVEHLNTMSYFFCSRKPDSYDCNERHFWGSEDPHSSPGALRHGSCFNSSCEGENPIGAFQHRIALGPGETTTLHFVLGFESNTKQVLNLRATLGKESVIKDTRHEVLEFWETECARFRITTPEPDLDRFMNYWLKKQILFQSRLNRLCAVFPIRNQLQDYMGYAMFAPKAATSFLLPKFQKQHLSGFLQQWHTEDGENSHGLCHLDFKDGGIWLTICTLIITHQLGSSDLLDLEIEYKDCDDKESLYDHIKRALAYLARERGRHGFCLLGEGDWTDPINGPGRKGRGESTWSTCALSFCALLMEDFASARGDLSYVEELRILRRELKNVVNRHAWNGQWYVTGFDDDGKPFGTKTDQEGRIFLNCQTWPIMAGMCDDLKIKAIYKSLLNLNTPCGPLLVWPAFSRWNPTWGRISLKLAGTSENGSVYCHASMFKAYADCVVNKGDDALNTVMRTLPTNSDNPPEKNSQIPLYVPNYYYGLQDSPCFGQSSRHHATGTAPWLQWVVLEKILGVQATIKGLLINPHMPSSWDTAYVERQFKDAFYKIHLQRDKHPRVVVNGEEQRSTLLPYAEGTTYEVNVYYS